LVRSARGARFWSAPRSALSASKNAYIPRASWTEVWTSALLDKASLYTNSEYRFEPGGVLLQRVLVVPILFANEPLGVFVLANRPDSYTDEHLEAVEARVDEVERHVRLLGEHLVARQRVALAAGDDPQHVAELGVGEVGLVATQVEVETRGAGDRSGDAVRRGRLRIEHADAAQPRPERLAGHHGVERGQS